MISSIRGGFHRLSARFTWENAVVILFETELAKQPNRAGDKPVPHKPWRCGRKKNDLRFAATGPLLRALGVDLTEIEGIDVGTALVILAEIGVDLSRFPTEKHFASWLGLFPNTSRSNLREKKHSPRQEASRVKKALRMCAQSCSKTPLVEFERRFFGAQQSLSFGAQAQLLLRRGKVYQSSLSSVRASIVASEAPHQHFSPPFKGSRVLPRSPRQ
jgi:hypothetical protein